jgi:hypothetical protein
MLHVIDESLATLLDFKAKVMNSEDRLTYFSETNKASFNRKAYMTVFQEISTATASRDLKLGIELGLFEKEGDKSNTTYKFI